MLLTFILCVPLFVGLLGLFVRPRGLVESLNIAGFSAALLFAVKLFKTVLVQVSAETTQRILLEAGSQPDPWNELVHGIDTFLDACTTPEMQRIVLIDGPELAKLMIDHNVGVSAVRSYEIKKIDSDYFTEGET